jgi:hypothetical protein
MTRETDTSEQAKRGDRVRAMSAADHAALRAALPAFITYPRVGSQWLEAVMERYFDRPCLRERRATLIDPDRDDWLFFHDHDRDFKLRHDNTLYLYRSPVETVYSYLIYHFKHTRRKSWWGRWLQRNGQPITRDKVLATAKDYRAHLEKWLLSERRARAVVRYELLQTRPLEEFARICDFFALPFDAARVTATLEEASRRKMVEIAVKKSALDASLLSDGYRSARADFMREYGDLVHRTVITPALAPHFAHLESAD